MWAAGTGSSGGRGRLPPGPVPQPPCHTHPSTHTPPSRNTTHTHAHTHTHAALPLPTQPALAPVPAPPGRTAGRPSSHPAIQPALPTSVVEGGAAAVAAVDGGVHLDSQQLGGAVRVASHLTNGAGRRGGAPCQHAVPRQHGSSLAPGLCRGRGRQATQAGGQAHAGNGRGGCLAGMEPGGKLQAGARQAARPRTSMRLTTPEVTDMVSPPIGYLQHQWQYHGQISRGATSQARALPPPTASHNPCPRPTTPVPADAHTNAHQGRPHSTTPARGGREAVWPSPQRRHPPDDRHAVLQERQAPKVYRLQPLPKALVLHCSQARTAGGEVPRQAGNRAKEAGRVGQAPGCRAEASWPLQPAPACCAGPPQRPAPRMQGPAAGAPGAVQSTRCSTCNTAVPRLTRQQRYVALHANGQHLRHVLGVAAAPLHLDLRYGRRYSSAVHVNDAVCGGTSESWAWAGRPRRQWRAHRRMLLPHAAAAPRPRARAAVQPWWDVRDTIQTAAACGALQSPGRPQPASQPGRRPPACGGPRSVHW